MATITSTTSGLWSAGTTWVGGVAPVNGDKVYIANTHVVTVEGNCEGGDDTSTAINVQSGGTLKFSRTANSQLTCNGELLILTGGTLDIGTSASPIPLPYTATIVVNRSAVLADSKWGVTTQNKSFIKMYGAAKQTNTLLVNDIAIGATTARVENGTGWQVGDTVCFAPTASVVSEQDLKVIATITNVSGTIYDITWTGGTTYGHKANGPVGNFTNNIIFQPYNSSYRCGFYLFWGTDQAQNSHELRYVTFRNMSAGVASAYNRYGALTLTGPNQSTNWPCFISIGNLVFYQDYTLTCNCQILSQTNKDRLIVNDIAIYSPGTGVYGYAGYVMDMNRMYIYRTGTGVIFGYSEGSRNHRFYDCYFTGCSSAVVSLGGGIMPSFYRCYYFASNYPISQSTANSAYFENCYFGAGGKTPIGASFSNAYLIYSSYGGMGTSTMVDCFFDTSKTIVEPTSFLTADPTLKVIISNKNLDPSLQEIYTAKGHFLRDNTVFKTGVASLRCDPKSSSYSVSVDFQIFAPTGKPVVVSGYLRKNAAYGSSNLPFVTLSGLGITPSVSTMTDTNDTWIQFCVSGTQNSGTDGILTLTATFKSGGAGASAWIDGISAPPAAAVNTGDFGFWADGQPAKLIASNYTSAVDVWNTLTSNTTLEGSHGELATRTGVYEKAIILE